MPWACTERHWWSAAADPHEFLDAVAGADAVAVEGVHPVGADFFFQSPGLFLRSQVGPDHGWPQCPAVLIHDDACLHLGGKGDPQDVSWVDTCDDLPGGGADGCPPVLWILFRVIFTKKMHIVGDRMALDQLSFC